MKKTPGGWDHIAMVYLRIDRIVLGIASTIPMMAFSRFNASTLMAMGSAQLRVAVQQRGFIMRGSGGSFSLLMTTA